MTDEQIDVLAQPFLTIGDGDTEHDSIDWRGFARALLSASKPAAPEGWKLVPVELTTHMLDEADFAMQNHVGDAYTESDDFDGWYSPVWKAILAASPAAPAQSGEPVANDWKASIDNELVTIESTADSFSCAREAVKALIDWHVAVALDPAVSSDAQALIDKGKQSAVVLDDERAAFEAWAFNDTHDSANLPTDRNALGDYADPRTDGAWHGWMAKARATSPQPVAQTERALTVDHAVACMKEALIEPKWNVTAGEIADVLKRTRALLTAAQQGSGADHE